MPPLTRHPHPRPRRIIERQHRHIPSEKPPRALPESLPHLMRLCMAVRLVIGFVMPGMRWR
jgi:hypothetical protein